jgi:hypothetical protein
VKNDGSGSTVSIKKIDANTFEETFKHAGPAGADQPHHRRGRSPEHRQHPTRSKTS